MNLHIRTAAIGDLPRCAAIEAACFPRELAASQETIRRRIETYPGHVLVGLLEEEIVGYIMGPVVDRPAVEDFMFSDPGCHREDGICQAVLSLAVMPAGQRRGYGGQLTHAMVALARQEGRKAVALTCRQDKVRYYEALGFTCRGPSASARGGVSWCDMVREL